MSRERLIEMAREQLAHQRAGTVPLAPAVTRLPVANYFEPTRWRREIDLLFKRLPLALGMSAELVGPHQRITGPRGKWLAYADRPESEWPLDLLTTGIWSIFPHGSIAGFEIEGGTLWQIARIFPGDTPESSVSHLDYVSLTAPTPEFRAAVDQQIEFLVHVVRDEDYSTGLDIQRTVRTGAKTEFVFGRNEGGAQHVHGWIDRVLDTTDDELDDLFRATRPTATLVAGD